MEHTYEQLITKKYTEREVENTIRNHNDMIRANAQRTYLVCQDISSKEEQIRMLSLNSQNLDTVAVTSQVNYDGVFNVLQNQKRLQQTIVETRREELMEIAAIEERMERVWVVFHSVLPEIYPEGFNLLFKLYVQNDTWKAVTIDLKRSIKTLGRIRTKALRLCCDLCNMDCDTRAIKDRTKNSRIRKVHLEDEEPEVCEQLSFDNFFLMNEKE